MKLSTPCLLSLFDCHMIQAFITWINVAFLRSSCSTRVCMINMGIQMMAYNTFPKLQKIHWLFIMFFEATLHFVRPVQNKTTEDLNTISFHGLIPDTYQCFHQLYLHLPRNVCLLDLDILFQLLGIIIDKIQGIDTSTRWGNSDNTVIMPAAYSIAFAIKLIIECASFFFL